MSTWPSKAMEDLACYLVRAPLSLQKLVHLDGQKAVLYRSRMNPSLGRNFEAMDPLEWLARLADHIPDPGRHRTHFYAHYAAPFGRRFNALWIHRDDTRQAPLMLGSAPMRVLRLRAVALLAASAPLMAAEADLPPKRLWTELNARRQEIPSLHQEFEATRTISSRHTPSQSSKWRIVVDVWQGRWRETSGSGDYTRVFDGKDVFAMEEGGDEYVRTPHRPKDAAPQPAPYAFTNADWTKAMAPRPPAPCGLPGPDRPCVTLQAPVKRWVRGGRDAGHTISLLNGAQRVVLDAQTGMLVTSQVLEVIDNGWGGYTSDYRLALKRWSQDAPMDPSLFTAPVSDLREVKELSPWDAARIEKRLAGRPAPDMTVTDLRGQPLALSAFKGKYVLLDFWTTWCPPCRADGPALEKLYRRYGDKELMVVGVSVDEGRDVVEPYLKQHPPSYPVVLSSENELPRAYRVGVIPTYIVIDKEGSVTAAVEGDKGFGGLRRLLKKAGLETDE